VVSRQWQADRARRHLAAWVRALEAPALPMGRVAMAAAALERAELQGSAMEEMEWHRRQQRRLPRAIRLVHRQWTNGCCRQCFYGWARTVLDGEHTSPVEQATAKLAAQQAALAASTVEELAWHRRQQGRLPRAIGVVTRMWLQDFTRQCFGAWAKLVFVLEEQRKSDTDFERRLDESNAMASAALQAQSRRVAQLDEQCKDDTNFERRLEEANAMASAALQAQSNRVAELERLLAESEIKRAAKHLGAVGDVGAAREQLVATAEGSTLVRSTSASTEH
jgi:hypothetical protein